MMNLFMREENIIIREYVYYLKQNILFDENEHPWMRMDPFTSDIYQCKINGKKIALKDVLWGNESIRKENIIIISGKKHIGKSFFAEKVLRACEQSVYEERRNLFLANGQYRIPIIIERNWLERKNCEKNYELQDLITDVIGACVSVYNKTILKQAVTKLLMQGRFVLYFKDNDWIKNEEDIARLLKYGNLYEKYLRRTKYHNIVLLTSDVEGKIKDSFLNERNCGYIDLDILSIDEVEKYLQNRLSHFCEIARRNKDVMDLLRYPEHLKMFEALYNPDRIIELLEIDNKFKLYDFFIRENIRKFLKKKGIYSKGREDKIYGNLREYAWKKLSIRGAGVGNPSRYFLASDYEKAGLLDADKEFEFPYCGYYLAAEYLVENIESLTTNRVKKEYFINIKENEVETILKLASKMIGNIETFSKYWTWLSDELKYPLLLLARILKESNYYDKLKNTLYDKAFQNLKSSFYDYSVLETFEELKPECADYLKSQYLSLGNYNDKEKSNIKKRIVYYLGISHNGIMQEMINEFTDDKTDKHLKYHIIRAAVENYNNDTNSTIIIDKNIDLLSAYCYKQDDPIIKSDFSILFYKCKNGIWQSGQEREGTLTLLEKKLTEGIYWIRAHAAGALGRQGGTKIIDLLLTLIDKELENIYNQNLEYCNSIKVISYSVEALCEMCDSLGDEKDKVIERLVGFIDIAKLYNMYIEDAFSTIATGIEYMINSNRDKLAFNLGGRFRNRTSNYKRILLYILEELVNYYEDDLKMEQIVKTKCQELGEKQQDMKCQDIKNIRILHLSDWHLFEEGTDNTLIISKLRKLRPVNLLIITGDLTQFGHDYSKTLEILKKIVSVLEIKNQDVYMVPGNHDSGCITNQKEIYKKIREKIEGNKDFYNEYGNELYSAFCNYQKFLKEFYGEEYCKQGGIDNELFMWNNCLQILCLNTALLCDEDSSKKKIIDSIELAKIERKGEVPIIAISHHPWMELYDLYREVVKSKFEDLKVSVLLSGDRHRSENTTIGTVKEGIPNLIIGKTYSNNDDNFSEKNIALYELNLETKKMVPYLKKWEKGNFVPDMQFSHKLSGDNKNTSSEEKWEPMVIDLL